MADDADRMTMADDAERRLLEDQLELQLQEQRESIAALDEALASDPQNPEILEVHAELLQAIKDAEEGLFVLKRARLLQEVDLLSKDESKETNQESLDSKDVEVELLKASNDMNQDPLVPKQTGMESFKEYSIGSKCRFRHSDGRWYDGSIVALEGSTGAKVSFLTPTSDNQLICKFFLQQRCRFGAKCRLSHGIDLPLSSLKKYTPTIWTQSLVGSNVWAISDTKTGIWREAELASWDEELGSGRVVFRDDGRSSNVGNESISISEYAQMSDDDDADDSDSYSGSEQYDLSENETEDASEGLGFLASSNLQRGIQTETAIFAQWENHTRGIASKMMANMGFREGMGLGVRLQGRVDPISVKVLPPKQSLDLAFDSLETKDEKKRSRGGKRKRDKKFAALAKAAKLHEEQPSSDIFSLINTQLAMHDEALKVGSTKKPRKRDFQECKNGERRALVAFDDEVKELRARVQKLEEMASRNKKEKVVYEAAVRKLNETRKNLAEVEAAQASASNAVASKEKEKRWLKF